MKATRSTAAAKLGAGMALLLAQPALAHHSYSMFDPETNLSLAGKVKSFEWRNPHVFIQLLVPHEGVVREWSIELSSPSHLVRNGWKPRALAADDEITVLIHPLRDGRPGGSFVSAKFADGRPIGRAAKVDQP